MILGVDHVVIAVRDLDDAAAALGRELGLDVAEGGHHLALGTRNALAWLGDSYLELLAVTDPALAARSWIGAPALAALARGGGVATYALASDDIAAEVRRLHARGSNLIGPLPGERLRPDGQAERWQLALLPELGPDRPPFLIEHLAGSPEWRPEARDARALQRHPAGRVRLCGLEVPVGDPDTSAAAYAAEIGIALAAGPAPSSGRRARIGGQAVALVVARSIAGVATGPATIALSSDEGGRRAADLLGCRFVIGPEAEPA